MGSPGRGLGWRSMEGGGGGEKPVGMSGNVGPLL